MKDHQAGRLIGYASAHPGAPTDRSARREPGLETRDIDGYRVSRLGMLAPCGRRGLGDWFASHGTYLDSARYRLIRPCADNRHHAYPVSSATLGGMGRPEFPRTIVEFQARFPDEDAC